MKARPGARGFTLLELIVVLVIIAVMVGLVVPYVSSVFFQPDLKTTGLRFAECVRQAYVEASVTGTVWEVRILAEQGEFVAAPEGVLRDDDTFGNLFGEEPGNVFRREVAGQVKVTDVVIVHTGPARATPVFRILPRGLAEETYLELTDDDGKRLTVHVKPFNVRVAFLDEDENWREKITGLTNPY